MKRVLKIIMALSVLSTFAGCSRQTADIPDAAQSVVYPQSVDQMSYDEYQSYKSANPVDETMRQAVNSFAVSSAVKLFNSASGNLNYSPLSLYYALAICAMGAEGNTQTELLAALGFADTASLGRQCQNLFKQLYQSSDYEKLLIANSIWVDSQVGGQDISFNTDFLNTAAAQFYTSCFEADFADAATASRISEWISQQTENVLHPQIVTTEDEVIDIINTIYYYSRWSSPLDPAGQDTFTTAAGTVNTDYLATSASGSLYSGTGYVRSSLNLRSGSITFVLPADGYTTDDFLNDEAALTAALTQGQCHQGLIQWRLPAFEFDNTFDLVDMVKALGIETAFSMNADFSGMTAQPVCISRISQGSHIGLDQYGLTAAAYTEIVMDATSIGPQQQTYEMIINRPAIYTINSDDGTILFIGVLANPQA